LNCKPQIYILNAISNEKQTVKNKSAKFAKGNGVLPLLQTAKVLMTPDQF
jgi:hypothetical protein